MSSGIRFRVDEPKAGHELFPARNDCTAVAISAGRVNVISPASRVSRFSEESVKMWSLANGKSASFVTICLLRAYMVSSSGASFPIAATNREQSTTSAAILFMGT